jgi:hypothetical protein
MTRKYGENPSTWYFHASLVMVKPPIIKSGAPPPRTSYAMSRPLAFALGMAGLPIIEMRRIRKELRPSRGTLPAMEEMVNRALDGATLPILF